MITVQDICLCIEDFAPLSCQESWDNCGLLIGNPLQTVDRALLTIDVTEAVVAEAIHVQAQMIVAHHPLILSGIKRLTGSNDVQRATMLAIRNHIAVYAAHTSMDVASGGVSHRMAAKLGLYNLQVLLPQGSALQKQNADTQVGLGVVGMLPNPMSELNFLEKLKETFLAPIVRHTRLRNKSIRRVALCGGSGSSLLTNAIRSEADVFVTADFKYHKFADAEQDILVADIGHFESEQFTKEIFREILLKNFPTFAAHFSKTITNPINYI
jgi:dinuclear metal center YbgI/SA1388 family protein